jgi:hypothetical protein
MFSFGLGRPKSLIGAYSIARYPTFQQRLNNAIRKSNLLIVELQRVWNLLHGNAADNIK